MSPILCGIDRSPEAQEVASVGAQLAARGDGRLRLVHVVPTPDVTARPFATRVERQRDAETFERAGHTRVVLDEIEVPDDAAVERAVEFGDPASTLAALAVELPADLIVVGSGSFGLERIMLGSTAAALVKDAPCPVVVVPRAALQCSGEVLLCGLDGSKFAAGVARAAEQLARCLMLELVLVRVAEEAAGPDVADAPVERVPPRGSTAETLAGLGRDRGAAVVLVGARGRGPLTAAVLGSVSSELMELADRPVVVVPPTVSLAKGV